MKPVMYYDIRVGIDHRLSQFTVTTLQSMYTYTVTQWPVMPIVYVI